MKLKNILTSSLPILVALILSLSLTMIVHENPLTVLKVLFKSAFGSNYDFGLTLYYMTTFILTGLAFLIGAKASIFNIGIEGQLMMGALGATIVGVQLSDLPMYLGLPFGVLIALLFSGFWGLLASYLKAKFDISEIISTMMLNFIAAGICSFLILHWIPNPNSQNPESQLVGNSFLLQEGDPMKFFFPDSMVNYTFFIAIVLCGVVWYFFKYTRWGFELIAVGESLKAAKRGGVHVGQIKHLGFFLSSLAAGLVGINEVYGSSGQFKLGFSADFGFTGIAVSLLARNNPIGIIFSALLFACLHKGSMDLDLETQNITRDFSKILQAAIILAVCYAAYRKQKSTSGSHGN